MPHSLSVIEALLHYGPVVILGALLLFGLAHLFTPRRHQRVTRALCRHAALATGAMLFGFPFLWLVSTTFKADREIIRERIEWVPDLPYYARESPYLSQSEYRNLARPLVLPPRRWAEVRDALTPALWRAARAQAPAGTALPAQAADQVVRGLWDTVRKALSAEQLAQPPATVAETAAAAVTPDAVREVWERVHKQLVFGELHLLNYENVEVLPAAEVPPQPWPALAPNGIERAPLGDKVRVDREEGFLLRYADRPGEPVALDLARDVPFRGAAADLQSLTLNLHDDQSWRHVVLTLRTPDGVFRARRPFLMGTGKWQDATWVFREPTDRTSLSIPLDRVPGGEATPAGRLAIEVRVEATSAWGALVDKFARNYREAVRYVPFWTFTRNSVYLVVLNILGQLTACSLVAYAFSRLRWPGRDVLFVVLLATMMLPPQVTMLPVFLIVRKLHWYNTLKPLWLPSFFGSAFFIFLLRQFFMTIPRDLEDAAKIDGCGFLGVYWRIMLPLVMPALAAVAIFQFLGSWNDFMGPLIYINDLRLTPLSLGLFQFQQEHTAEWGMLMAGSFLMTLPAIIIFFVAQRYFIQGVTLTGLKG